MGRSLWSYGRVQGIVARALRGRRVQSRFAPRRSMLNVGCGVNIHPDYVNLDWTWQPGIDLCWDIRKPIPLPDSSLDGIFTEHCMEHVTYDETAAALRDFYRMLKPGGVVRIIVPDGELYLDLYQRAKTGADADFPYIAESGIADLKEDSRFGFTPMMAVNRIFRGYEHLFAYDHDTMANLLKQAGFHDIAAETFRHGRFAPLLIDAEINAPQSMFIEASK